MMGNSNLIRAGRFTGGVPREVFNGTPARRIMPMNTGGVGDSGMAAAPNMRQPMRGGMVMAGSTAVSPTSLKGESFSGRAMNLSCKAKFKAGSFCERD
jgi:hypothetical protein